ncbi:hypothetical protein ACCS54_13985 [Rhizobium johnstonii]|uniref:hypothetical protein n=1 Tax=Rhizobium johnstonii TaxID=3019933 RepID=UPI003F99A914
MGGTTDYIFSEVIRVPAASVHVPSPELPEVVYGIDPDELRARHDKRTAAAKTSRTDRSGKVSIKAIRKDQNTLAGLICSHPAAMDEYRANVDVRCGVADWKQRSIAGLRDQHGDSLVSVIRHTEESHPHLHAYLLPDDMEMRVGVGASRLPRQERRPRRGPLPGEDKKAMGMPADRAFVSGMRRWLDDYHEKVAIPAGLTGTTAL